jgi:uncharacterized membrane protein
MSNITVIIFDGVDTAKDMRDTLKKLEKQGLIKVEDAATVYKDADGKVKAHGEASSGSVGGALVGGFLGVLLAGVFFPVLAIGLMAGAGALIGKSLGQSVDKKFVQEVQNALQPGNSAIFAVTSHGNPAAVRAALEPYKGTLYHTSLDSEQEAVLRDALK